MSIRVHSLKGELKSRANKEDKSRYPAGFVKLSGSLTLLGLLGRAFGNCLIGTRLCTWNLYQRQTRVQSSLYKAQCTFSCVQMPNESAAMLSRKCAILCLLWALLCAGLVLASKSCLYCRGINCQRSSYQATEQCLGAVDTCVSVFQSGMVRAQGCYESLEHDWRQYCGGEHKCRTQCEVCATDKCNNATSRPLSCIQCRETEVSGVRLSK